MCVYVCICIFVLYTATVSNMVATLQRTIRWLQCMQKRPTIEAKETYNSVATVYNSVASVQFGDNNKLASELN